MLRLALITGCAALQHKYGRETYGASVTRGAADLPPLLLIPPVGVGIDRQFYARLQDAWAGGDTHARAPGPDGDRRPDSGETGRRRRERSMSGVGEPRARAAR